MILSGMGPLLQPCTTTGGKLFAASTRCYSGLAVLVIAGVIFGPGRAPLPSPVPSRSQDD
jgi:hypothetical protein